MSNKKVSVDNLAKEITQALDDFYGATAFAMDMAVDEAASEALRSLHNAHPSGSEEYGSWDEYNSGWTVTQTKRDKAKHIKQIHNKTHYQLTHLLEKGHATVDGGRTRAFKHIAPVVERCESDLIKDLRKYI